MQTKNKSILVSLLVVAVLTLGVFSQTKVFASTDFVIKTEGSKKVLVKYKGDCSKVVIPQGVEIIGEKAFSGNKKIKSVKLSSTVKEIGDYAFDNCSNLKTVKFSKGLKKIYKGAFKNCTKVKVIKINKNLKLLDEFVFSGCTGIKKVSVAKGNKHFKVKSEILYSKNMKTLYFYPSSLNDRKKFSMPKSVNTVYACAFSRNRFLEEITINSKISSGESAFSNCKSLKKVIFKKAYKSGVDFSNCKKLTTVVLAEGTKIIGESQFEGCKNLENINFPSSLEIIDMYAFSGCEKVEKPVLPSTVEVD